MITDQVFKSTPFEHLPVLAQIKYSLFPYFEKSINLDTFCLACFSHIRRGRRRPARRQDADQSGKSRCRRNGSGRSCSIHAILSRSISSGRHQSTSTMRRIFRIKRIFSKRVSTGPLHFGSSAPCLFFWSRSAKHLAVFVPSFIIFLSSSFVILN